MGTFAKLFKICKRGLVCKAVKHEIQTGKIIAKNENLLIAAGKKIAAQAKTPFKDCLVKGIQLSV